MTYIGPDQIIEKKKAFYMPCSHHFYKHPPQFVKGEMQYLYDQDGKQYLDFFAGVSVMNCGHSNPAIINETIEQLKQLQHMTTIYLTENMVLLAEKLASILPGDIKRSFFCNSGSEAMEGAMLLARLFTNKEEFIYLEGGLHGRTFLSSSVIGIPMWRTDPFLNEALFHQIKRPWDYNLSLEDAAERSLEELENVLVERGDKIAAMVCEPLQGNGGIIMPEPSYFKRVKALLEKYHVLLIVDEVQTGFARTGKMFAIEHFDVNPDIMVVAKALGNGIPIGAFCSTDKITEKFTKPSTSTLGGNPVSTRTALAVINYIENNQLINRAKRLGQLLKEGLINLQAQFPIIHEVRGTGLMLGVELLKSDGQVASEETDQILECLKDKGILVGKNGLGRNVLAFQPPLIITEENVKQVLKELEEALKSLK
jgi:alanine-glyoxylate transaminase / (R)-3-amino-2-methylpropionate-pyruvate transaminase